ncbi:sugar transporter [Jannaschia seosinensis]|nr:sugar transporter [Jannaschia seosinensis]
MSQAPAPAAEKPAAAKENAPSPAPGAAPKKAPPKQAGKPNGGAAAAFAPAPPARRKTRHVWLFLSFALFFAIPVAVSAWYLYAVARDQYASSVAFTVRTEDTQSAIDLLGGIKSLGGASSSDTDILYEFVQSQQLVVSLDEELDLREMFSVHWPEDPIFAFNPDGTIEDLTAYWNDVVNIYYDSGTGLIELRVKAFRPEDAFAVATGIFERSSQMINDLSAIAREDATRYARDDLALAVDRLKGAREAILRFRARTQIIDPQADLQGQMGILNTLQQQYATAIIDLDLLRETTRDEDPRIAQAETRIRVIESRINAERGKFSSGSDGLDDDYVTIIGEFERLNVDLEFAQSAYLAALAAYDSAIAEAQRQSRYLAAYLKPSVAQRALYPERTTLLGLIAAFALLAWVIASLVYYSVRDRG